MIKIGIVGARGLSFMTGFQNIEGVKVEALCDLDEDLLRKQSQTYGIGKTFRVYDDMLECDIDAVVVATPMQFHVMHSIAALQAGKHVMSEVTAGVNMEELWWLVEEVEKSGKSYMFAENYCYIPQVQLIQSMVDKGLFGDLYYAEGEYLHELKNLSVYENGKVSWRSYWQLGRRGNFYPTHSLGPLMKWFKNERIESVTSFGTGWNTVPEFRQEDTSVTLCRTKSGKLIKLRLDCLSQRPHNLSYYTVQGTNGCYEAPRGMGDDHKIWFKGMDKDTDHARWRPLADFYDDHMPERYKNATKEQINAGHWGGDFFIVEDFINAIKNKTKPPIDIYDACEWTAVALLSELSIMNNNKQMQMPDFKAGHLKENQITKI